MTTITGHQITRLAGDRVKASAQINLNGQSHPVSFIVPGESVYEGIEPFLTLALVPAMTVGQTIELNTLVSPRLLANIANIQDIFQNWDEQFHRIPVNAPTQTTSESNLPGQISGRVASVVQALAHRLNKKAGENPFNAGQSKTKDERKVACLFSGGVDSFYTLLKHFDEIDSLIFVSAGFDIYPHPNNAGVRRMISDRLRGVARQMGKEFLDVEIHVQNFSDQYINWFWYHGSAMAALAQLLSNRFHKVYFASSYAYNNLTPTGSSPLIDQLWSMEDFEIVHDGCEKNRATKGFSLAKSEIALKNLRVCGNYGENREYNCGKCEKCVRTMLELTSCEVTDFSVFGQGLVLETIQQFVIPDRLTRDWERILNRLTDGGKYPEVILAVKKALANSHNAEGEGEIESMEQELAEQERRFRLQNGWARGLEEDNLRLTRQIGAANQWGYSLEKNCWRKAGNKIVGYDC